MGRLTGLFNDQSTTGPRRADEIKLLPLDSIIPNAANFYGMRDIEQLAADIEEHGLMHNLVVKETDDYGVYQLIDGERRYRAMQMLGWQYANSLVMDVRTDAEAEYALIQANATQRDQTDYERALAAVRLVELMKQLRAEGHAFKGRTRELVAKALDVSPAQVGRYEKIERDLVPELKQEFKEGKLGVTDAYTLSTHAASEQTKAAQEIRQAVKKQKQKPIEEPNDVQNAENAAAHEESELDDILAFICDAICNYPLTVKEDELEKICTSCPIENRLRALLGLEGK